jgi:uncharacterized membrane protein YecN with MAPEG domain
MARASLKVVGGGGAWRAVEGTAFDFAPIGPLIVLMLLAGTCVWLVLFSGFAVWLVGRLLKSRRSPP